ncbi:MAG: insulinase family protein [Candidatus Omnitrophica bacterium]|nr:insulinase family protein [Candidatus Omnitrophota bacterium]
MKKRILIGVLFCIFLSVGLPILAKNSSSGPSDIKFNVKKRVLDNGLTVLISEMPQTSTVSLYMLVKAGSTTEGEFLGAGLSHFIEHMLFKGTNDREAGAISREVQSLGGVINASTSFDYTIYTISLPHDNFSKALDILSDMIKNAQFDPEEIEKEREVVYNEMRMLRDNPDRYVSELIFRTVYPQHPYGIPIIGYPELLRDVSRDDILKYFKKYYVPNNMVLAIAGKVKADEILPEIEESFRDFERKSYVPRNIARVKDQISFRQYEEEYPTELARLSITYSGVSLTHKDMPAMDVLAMIFGQGESSRLYNALVKEERIVRSIYSFNYTPIGRGVFGVDAVLDYENAPEAIVAITKQVALIKTKGVSAAELKKAKRQVLSEFISRLQTTGSVAYSIALNEAFLGDSEYARQYVNDIEALTVKDIRRVAQKYLNAKQTSQVILKPKKIEGEDAVKEGAPSEAAQAVRKIEFDNGLTVLLRENHNLPLVSLQVAFNGGLLFEPDDLNGISKLTANLWVKGTKSRNAASIETQVESLGASLAGFSGRNSFGVQMEFLSQDIQWCVDLLVDILMNPTFNEDELIKERKDMLTAILQQDDSIFHITKRELLQMLFAKHPYRQDQLGTAGTIGKITRNDIIAFYNELFVPNNMVITVFGDIDSKEMENLLYKKFAHLQKKDVPPSSIRAQGLEKSKELENFSKKQQAMVMVGFQGAGYHHQDRYGLDVLTAVLGSSFSGRIFSTIREDLGQAYTLGGNYVPGHDTGIIIFYVLTKDDIIIPVRDKLLEIIDQVSVDFVSDQELEDTLSYLKGTFQMGTETNSALGFMATLDELYDVGYDHYTMYPQLIDNVSKAELRKLAQKYLSSDKAVVVLTRPQKEQ